MSESKQVSATIQTVGKASYYKPVYEKFQQMAGNYFINTRAAESHFNKEVSYLIQSVHKNNQLAKCNPESFLQVIINVAQSGLTLDPTKDYASVIPRWNNQKKRLEAHFDPGYKGLIHLIAELPNIDSIEVHLIYSNDEVMIDLSDNKKIVKHVPALFHENGRGEVVGAYSRAKLSNGEYHVEIMTKYQIYEIRDKYSEGYKAYQDKKTKHSVWVDSEEEMIRKTVLRRHWKWLPKQDEDNDKLSAAIKLTDEGHGAVIPATYESKALAYNLLETSTLSGTAIDQIYQEITDTKYNYEVSDIIGRLKEYQPEPEMVQQKQIIEAVAEKVEMDDERDLRNYYEEIEKDIFKLNSVDEITEYVKHHELQNDDVVKKIINRKRKELSK